MADIKVVIQLQDTAEDEITDLGSSSEVNNASIQKTNGSFGSLSTKSDGTNMKSWANVIKDSEGNVVSKVVNGETISRGLLSLADGYVGGADTKLIEQYGYNGYVFGAVPETKQLTVTLEVRGENIDSIIIYGDKNANQFPTKAYRDGNPNDIIYSDDATWAIKFDNVASSHAITFLEWNRANYNACINYVAELKKELTLDKSWIKSVESLSQSTGQPKEIYYGVTPSSGSLEIIDRDGEIKDYLQDGILSVSKLPIELYANGKKLQNHISEDGDYSNDGILSIRMTNELSSWNTLYFKGMPLQSNLSLYDILKIVLKSINIEETDINNMLLGHVYDNSSTKTIKEHLESITIPYSYLNDGTVRDTIQKICDIAQLSVIQDSEGKIIFSSLRPTGSGEERVVNIKKSNIFGTPTKDIIVKNAIDKVSLDYNKVVFKNENVISLNLRLNSQNNNAEENSIKYIKYYTDESQNNDVIPTTNITGIANAIATPVKQSSTTMEGTISEQSLFYCVEREIDGFSFLNNGVLEISRDFNYYKSISTDENLTVGYFNSQSKIKKQESLSEINEYDSVKSFLETFFDATDRPPYIEKDYELKKEYRGKTQYGIVKSTNGNKIKVTLLMILPFRWYSVTYGTIQNIPLSYDISLKYDMLSTESLTYNYNTSTQTDRLINSNELIQNTDICSTIAKNLISDYSNGIKTNRLSVSCVDYYYVDGSQAKDWGNGEIIQIGELVKITDDNTIWRVTGRNFRKVGVPMIDLELQEVRVV